MEPFTLLAFGAGAYLLLRKRGKGKPGGNLPRIVVSADCSAWDIPEPWYAAVAAPKYVQLVTAYPESMPLETRTSRVTESILIGETGPCAAKDLPNITDAMRGLFDHVAEYVRDGLDKGGNPFLPGLAKYVVASEVFRNLPIIIVRRYDPRGTGKPYAWAVGKWGTSVQAIMSKMATLDMDNDNEIETLLGSFGVADTIDEALTKGRQVAPLGPTDAAAASETEHLFG